MSARSRFSKGQMLALFTIVLPVLLGVMALGVDFALIYLNWSMVQKAPTQQPWQEPRSSPG